MRPGLFLNRGLAPFGYRLVKVAEPSSAPDDDAPLYVDFPHESVEEKRFYNIGAGSFRHRYWTNVDFATDWYREAQKIPFLPYDLTRQEPLPVADAAAEVVYTSHTIEHVTDAAVANLCSEARRILRPGGFFRITCPDARLLVRSYCLDKISYWRWRSGWFLSEKASVHDPSAVTVADYLVREIATVRCRFCKNPVDALQPEEVRRRFQQLEEDQFLDSLKEGVEFRSEHPGYHINWWSEDKIISFLRGAGFSEVYTSRRGQSLCPPLTNTKLFDGTQPQNSLYVEAIR